jgi:hypothetical protein
VEGLHWFVCHKWGTASASVLGSCSGSFNEPIRGSHDLLRQKPPSLDIVRVELNLNGLSDNAVHISGFRGEDGRIVEFIAVSLVDTVFSYGRLVRMFYSYVPLILL